jgi:NADH-quinone oxidoreductase subunit C
LSSSETVTETAADGAEVEAPPRDDRREALLAQITEVLGDAVVGSHIRPGDDLWVRVDRDVWSDVHELARRRLGCTYFSFLSGLDWLPSPFGRDMDSQEDIVTKGTEAKELPAMASGYAGGDTRFQVFSRVNSPTEAFGVTFKADLPDDDLSVRSLVPIFAGAQWHEREAMEMFGFAFPGNPKPEHLYLPGAFEGFPLRKDFPLLSRRVKPWPGIVDVEPMPGQDDEDGEGESE